MKIGFTELLLTLAIFLVVLGPTVLPRIARWYRYADRAQNTARRRAARARAARVRVRDELFRRARFAVAVVFGGAAALYLLYLFFGPLPYAPQIHPVTTWISSAAEVPAGTPTAADGLDISPYRDPVCIAEQDGWLYAAVDGGTVIRIRPDGTGLAEVFTTGGDITALAFGPDGALYLTDASLQGTLTGGGGVLRATFDGWAVSVAPLVTSANGQRLSCPAGLAVGTDGTVYFTDFSAVSAAQTHSAENAFYTELMARTGQGSVYAYDPDTQAVACLASGLQGAGGLALSADGRALYVSESNAGRLWKLPLGGKTQDIAALGADSAAQSTGGAQLLAQGLSGYPAGLACDQDGSLWAAQCGARSRWAETAPVWLRRVILHLPRLTRAWLLRPHADAGTALGFSENGTRTSCLLVDTGAGGRITGICFTEDACWLANADGSVLYRAAPAVSAG